MAQQIRRIAHRRLSRLHPRQLDLVFAPVLRTNVRGSPRPRATTAGSSHIDEEITPYAELVGLAALTAEVDGSGIDIEAMWGGRRSRQTPL